MNDSASYFGSSERVDAGGTGVWFDLQHGVAPFDMVPGLAFRPSTAGNLMINLVSFEPNVIAPKHAHDEEQAVYVMEGEVEYEVGSETRTLRPGMAVIIPPNVTHGARTYDSTCLELDIFTPPRRALLEAMQSK
jgi:quercetin dioxygenase-like cupin family protein